MKTMRFLVAGFGVFAAVAGLGGASRAQDSSFGGGEWVQVLNPSGVPHDLSLGDRVEVSIGSAVSRRDVIVGIADCGTFRGYFTSRNQNGCGWHNAITAYSRSGTTSEAMRVLKMPQ